MSARRRLVTGLAVWAVVISLGWNGANGWLVDALWVLSAAAMAPPMLSLLIRSQASLARGVLRVATPAGGLAAVSLLLPDGPLAGILTVPWLLTALGAGLLGRALLRGPHGEPLAGLALLFLAIGGIWALCARAGMRPLGFDPMIVRLTAVHFHYAAFLTMATLALMARRHEPGVLPRPVAVTALGVGLGVVGTAAGITGTQLGAPPTLETVGAVVMALAGAGVALLHVHLAFALRSGGPRRWLFLVAGVSLLVGMVLAAVYGLRFAGLPGALARMGLPVPGIHTMVWTHGLLNGFGFGLATTVGFVGIAPSLSATRPR